MPLARLLSGHLNFTAAQRSSERSIRLSRANFLVGKIAKSSIL